MKSIMRTLVIALSFYLSAATNIWAGGVERPVSADYVNGVKALNEGDAEQAYKLLTSELSEHPDNGYAHCYMSLVCNYYGDMKLAMYAVNESLKLIPEEDQEYRSFAYYTRGVLYMNGKAYNQAEDDLDEAIRLCPSDVENYKVRAKIYLNDGKYQKALSDIQTVLKLDEQADVYDLMMQLLEANPDPEFFDQVTTCRHCATSVKD